MIVVCDVVLIAGLVGVVFFGGILARVCWDREH